MKKLEIIRFFIFVSIILSICSSCANSMKDHYSTCGDDGYKMYCYHLYFNGDKVISEYTYTGYLYADEPVPIDKWNDYMNDPGIRNSEYFRLDRKTEKCNGTLTKNDKRSRYGWICYDINYSDCSPGGQYEPWGKSPVVLFSPANGTLKYVYVGQGDEFPKERFYTEWKSEDDKQMDNQLSKYNSKCSSSEAKEFMVWEIENKGWTLEEVNLKSQDEKNCIYIYRVNITGLGCKDVKIIKSSGKYEIADLNECI